MATFLFFDTNKIVRIIKRRIKDGFVELDGKSFFIDQTDPFFLKKRFGYEPLYMIKWSNVEPSKKLNPAKSKVEKVSPEFTDSLKKYELTPELLRKLTGLKILGNMIKPKREAPSGILPLIIGLICGMLILYGLIAFRVIPV